MLGPETRHSLISKLSDPAATQAWGEFIQLYQPVIYRVARGRGLQHADAEDLTQEVLATVGRKVADFDCSRTGSFRGWLALFPNPRYENFALVRERFVEQTGLTIESGRATVRLLRVFPIEK